MNDCKSWLTNNSIGPIANLVVGICPLIHPNYFSVIIFVSVTELTLTLILILTLTLTLILTLTLNRPTNNSGELTDKHLVVPWSTAHRITARSSPMK